MYSQRHLRRGARGRRARVSALPGEGERCARRAHREDAGVGLVASSSLPSSEASSALSLSRNDPGSSAVTITAGAAPSLARSAARRSGVLRAYPLPLAPDGVDHRRHPGAATDQIGSSLAVGDARVGRGSPVSSSRM